MEVEQVGVEALALLAETLRALGLIPPAMAAGGFLQALLEVVSLAQAAAEGADKEPGLLVGAQAAVVTVAIPTSALQLV
jgi:hypothetical protein